MKNDAGSANGLPLPNRVSLAPPASVASINCLAVVELYRSSVSAKIMNSPNAVEQMEIALGPQRAKELQAFTHTEKLPCFAFRARSINVVQYYLSLVSALPFATPFVAVVSCVMIATAFVVVVSIDTSF